MIDGYTSGMNVIFNLVIVVPLLAWASMVLFPQRRFTLTIATSPWPIVVLALIFLVAGLGQVVTGAQAALDLLSMQQALSSPWGTLATVAGWQGLTLMAGSWIFRDARYYRIPTGPYLLATLLLGPVGPGAYLIVRWRKERSGPTTQVHRHVN